MMKIFDLKRQNLEIILIALLNSLKIKVTTPTALSCLHEHPEYPSMLALSDCLNGWQIDNQAYMIERAEYDPEDLLFPFVAHLKENGGRFLLIHSINQGKVKYTDEYHTQAVIKEEEFLNKWSGMALHAEKNELSGEKEYRLNSIGYFLQSLLIPFAFILTLAIFGLIVSTHTFSWLYLGLCLIKFLGVIVSILLLLQRINDENPFIQNLCSLGGKNKCNALLKSKASQVTKWLSWSEVGFYYFTGSLILLLIDGTSIGLLAYLNLLALPYTMYSITYQYKHKNWCFLCCTVQMLLWAEFLLNINTGYQLDFDRSFLYLFPITFLFLVIVWSFLKPYFYQASQLRPLKKQLNKFKYNTNLFHNILANQPKYAIDDDLMSIVLGNPDAENVITMVSNPFCGPCGKAHETLTDWLSTKEDFQLKIVFSTNNQDHDERTKVARHLTAFANQHNKAQAKEILEFWYNERIKYDQLAEKFPLNFNGVINDAMENQKKWCNMANITFTPTFFINGYKLPEPYQIDDLKYLIN